MKKPILAILACAAALAAAGAQAGVCDPADEIAGSMSADGHTESMHVTDEVLAVNRLGDYYAELASRDQRIRRLVVQPGGVVAWHSHADRPALIYVAEGEITEYSSNCRKPIEHKAGEVSVELGPIEHWWRNNGDRVAVLIAADLPRAD